MTRPLLLIAALAALGCQSEVERMEDFFSDLGAAVCGRVSRCCSAADLNDLGWTKAGGCQATFDKWFERPRYILTYLADEGLELDGDAARRCLDAIDAAACPVGMDANWTIRSLLVYQRCYLNLLVRGTRQQGESCGHDVPILSLSSLSTCAPGLVCDGPLLTPHGQRGTCKQAAAEGQSCASAQCQAELRCDTKKKQCVFFPRKGEACHSAACDPYAEPPLRCLSKVCTALKANGAPCNSDDQCLSRHCTPRRHQSSPGPV